MVELVDNKFGIEYKEIPVRRLRIFRVSHRWLVEYQRAVRWWAPWDYFWWYNDHKYMEYFDALDRINDIKEDRMIKIPQFQKVKTFEVEY